MRERWKEPPSWSEIKHEIVSSQAMGGESDLWPHACWKMSRWYIGNGLIKRTHQSRNKSESSWGNYHYLWTQTWVIYPWPRWNSNETKLRSELIDVEKSADELWLKVKCHLNPELAGFPWNVLRCSSWLDYLGVKHYFGASCESSTKSKQTLNIKYDFQIIGDKGQLVRWWGISFIVERDTTQITN